MKATGSADNPTYFSKHSVISSFHLGTILLCARHDPVIGVLHKAGAALHRTYSLEERTKNYPSVLFVYDDGKSDFSGHT